MNRRRQLSWLFGVAILASLWVWLGRPSQSDSKRAVSAPLEQASSKLNAAEPRKRLEQHRQKSGDVLPSPDADVVIKAVEVDKTSICRGEDVEVRVQAHSSDGADEYLMYGVAQSPDLAGPVFAMQPTASLTRGEQQVIVVGFGGTAMADIPAVEVRDCSVPFAYRIEQERSAAAPDRVVLSAQLRSFDTGDANELEPTSFSWDFGDGTQQVTSGPEVEHSYEGRLQGSPESYFPVKLRVQGKDGREHTTSRTLRFTNFGFTALKLHNRVQLLSSVVPLADHNEKISLYHGAPFEVQLKSVSVLSESSVLGGEEEVESHTAASFLGRSTLRPGEQLVLPDLSRFRPAAGGTRLIRIFGTGPDGQVAEGAVTLVAPDAQTEG